MVALQSYPTLGFLLHPHSPLWDVHAFPAFLECCLSAPSSAKEMLTAINYLTGWTKGIPLCLNISAHTHTQTHIEMLLSRLHPHRHTCREIPPGLHWSSSCLTNDSKCFVLWGRLIAAEPGWASPLSGASSQSWGCNDQATHQDTWETWERHTRTHFTGNLPVYAAAPTFMRWFYDDLHRYWLVMKSTLKILAVYQSSAVNQRSDISAIYPMKACLLCGCVCAWK